MTARLCSDSEVEVELCNLRFTVLSFDSGANCAALDARSSVPAADLEHGTQSCWSALTLCVYYHFPG
jgi:hypothetical protein